MKKSNQNGTVVKGLAFAARMALSAAANHRCALVYHQPKQPDGVKKFRKF